MKTKIILISFFNNGDLNTQIGKEYMYNKIVEDLCSEGRNLHNVSNQLATKVATFDDGSKVYLMPFGSASIGMRFTHVYFDKNIMNLGNANTILSEVYKPLILHGENTKFDTSKEKRIYTFEFDETLHINSI